MFAKGRHVLIGIIALSTVVAGVGYSAFSFKETAQTSTSAEPSPDNIRENFIFGDPAADSNIFDTKYYTVNFYGQYLGVNSVDVGKGTGHYNVSDGSSIDGYSHYFGFFRDEDIDTNLIERLGGTITKNSDGIGTYINCVTFENVSTITQEMLQAVGAPICTDSLDEFGKPDRGQAPTGVVDEKGWVLTFLSWMLVNNGSGNSAPDLYAAGRRWDGEKRYIVTGSYPTQGFEVPNFNLSLEYYDSYTSQGSQGSTLNFYPFLSTGKEYGDGDKNDAISLHVGSGVNNSSFTTYSTNFVYDPKMSSFGNFDVFRFPGFCINDPTLFSENVGSGENYQLFFQIDIYERRFLWNPGWSGEWDSLGSSRSSPFLLNGFYDGTSLPLGRYNFYLFVGTSELDQNSILSALNGHQIKPYRLYSDFQSIAAGSYYPDLNTRYFYLAVEKSFDVKLLGTETGYWDYDDAPYSPSFNQIISSDSLLLDEYEVRDVTMDGSKTTEYKIEKADGNGYSLMLPHTFFSIGIDQNPSRFNLHTRLLTYDENGTPHDAEGLTIPVTTAKFTYYDETTQQVVTESRPEYYSSSTYVSSDASESTRIDPNSSLISLNDWCEQKNAGYVSDDVSIRYDDGTTMSLAEAWASSPDLRDDIAGLQIFRVPSTGEYNIYLRFNYTQEGGNGAVTKLDIDMYFYKIHNIFVKIAAGSDIPLKDDNSNYVDTNNNDAFFSSTKSYYLLDKLSLDDQFAGSDGVLSLRDLIKNKQADAADNNYCYVLCDTVSGQYALPSSIDRGEFVIHKNHILEWKKELKTDVGWTNADDDLLEETGSNGGIA